jgi:CheY-like chemotaxis protein
MSEVSDRSGLNARGVVRHRTTPLGTRVEAVVATLPILLIDDDRAWLETLADYLREKGFATQTAHDPHQGLAWVEEHGGALAIIDFQMPGMDGLELLRHLRQRHPHLTVLMMSSEEEPSLARQALAEGARAFVAKTAVPLALLRILRQALGGRGAEVTAASARSLPQRRLPPQRITPMVLALTFRPSQPKPYALLPRPH